MPPSRFAPASPWRNLAAKALLSYSELPLSVSDHARCIAVSETHIYARAASPGSLVVLRAGEEEGGKLGGKVEQISLPISTSAADLEFSALAGGLLAVGSEDGSIAVLKETAPGSLDSVASFKHDTTSGPVLVRWHPHASDLLLTASPSSPSIHIWKISSDPQPALTITPEVGSKASGKTTFDMTWNADGSKVIAAFGDGIVKVYDPRKGGAALSTTTAPFGLPKPMRVAVTDSYVLSSTLNTSRQRELRVYSTTLGSPLQTITLDTASHPLSLTVDQDRGLVFLGSKGDVTLRWIELDEGKKFAQGAFPMPPRTSFGGAALLPAFSLEVMKAEINRLYVASGNGEVVPFRIEIPQRQLIDYHPHLFPDTASGRAALSADEWLAFKDATVQKVSMDPTKRGQWISARGSTPKSVDGQVVNSQNGLNGAHETKEVAETAPTVLPAAESEELETVSALLKTPVGGALKAEDPSPSLVAKDTSSTPAPSCPSAPASSPTAALERPSTTAAVPSAPAAATPAAAPPRTVSKPFNNVPSTSWSRATLTGVTPLLPAFSSVPSFDSSTSPSSRSFICTPTHLLYPLSGAGGRLAFHEIVREERLPDAKDVSWIETGGKVVDIESDPFDSCRVVTAGEEGIQVWSLPSAPTLRPGGGDSGRRGAEYEQVILTRPTSSVPLPEVGRIAAIHFNPIASDLLLVAGVQGIAMVDLSNSQSVKYLETDTAGEAEWSPDGTLIAFGRSSDRKLVIWDPRGDYGQAEIAAHDSPRPFKISWIDEGHLVTVGHMAGSMRQVKLFNLRRDGGVLALTEKGKLSLDTSPAILFPHYDPDAELLFLWSKGERSVSVLQVTLDPPKPKFGAAPPLFKALPAFQHSTPQLGLAFLPKRYVDVREVEVALSYRLSRTNEIQKVSWKVERKRKEFFQDDVFPPTRDVEKTALSAMEWTSSSEAVSLRELPHLDLRPAEMRPLSTAPPPETRNSSLSKGPTQRMLTAKERDEELMSNVFDKAKLGGDEEVMEETAARRRAPANDDWGDDD